MVTIPHLPWSGDTLRIIISALNSDLGSLPKTFKTIGGQPIVGEGDIELPTGGGEPYNDEPLVTAQQALANRVSQAEQALSEYSTLFEDTDLRFINVETRVLALEGGEINRAPNITAVPPQVLTVGQAVTFNAMTYASDPDGDAIEVTSQTGTLPPGLTRTGGAISGIPTTTGNFATVLVITDSKGASSQLQIPWSVALAPGAEMSVSPAKGGFSVKNAGDFPDHTIPSAVGGFSLEIA